MPHLWQSRWQMDKRNPTLIIGLGNPILGDDGVGWLVVQKFQENTKHLDHSNTELDIEFDYLAIGGLSLMERMEGCHDVILVDSIFTGRYPIGTVYSLPLDSLPDFSSGHSTSIHDTSLATALKLGRKMGLVLPENVWVVGIEANNVFEFSEKVSPEIESVVSDAAQLLMDIVQFGIRVKEINFPA